MSLIHVDKASTDLLNPSLNAPDVHIAPLAHGTSSISPRTPGSTAGKVITKDSRIIANDGTNNIGLFGFDDAGQMVVKVAQPGFDANSATDDQLQFNSQWKALQVSEGPYDTVLSTGNVSAGLTGSWNVNGTFSKSYSSIPIVLAFIKSGNSTGGLWAAGSAGGIGAPISPDAVVVGNGGNVVIQKGYSQSQAVNTTQVTFSLWYGNGSTLTVTAPSFTIRWYVLTVKAS